MADTDYIFHISPYDTEKLLPQVSRALEKRTEMVSRERFPGLWKHTDRFRSMARGRKRSRLRTRGMSALCLAAGIFLAVPGLMEPRELFVPLLVGAAAMGAGIIGLWQSRARKKNPFDRAAKILLEGKDKSSAEQAASVSFSEEGMTVPAGGGKAEFVPYREFECAVETADSFLWRPCPAVAENGLKSGMYRRFLQSDLGKSETVSLDCVKGRRQGKPMRLPSERKNAPASFKMR